MKISDVVPTGSLRVKPAAVYDDGKGGVYLDPNALGGDYPLGLGLFVRVDRDPGGDWAADLTEAAGFVPPPLPEGAIAADYVEARITHPAPAAS